VAGTYAKYTTTVVGTDAVTVAKWVANFDNGTGTTATDFSFNLFKTVYANTLGGGVGAESGVIALRLAPGTAGSFDVTYTTSTTETARNVSVTMNASALSGLTYLKFYGDVAKTKDITAAVIAGTAGNLLSSAFPKTGVGNGTKFAVADAAIAQDSTITVYWEWAFSANGAQDTADTTDGLTPLTAQNVTVTFSATQSDT